MVIGGRRRKLGNNQRNQRKEIVHSKESFAVIGY